MRGVTARSVRDRLIRAEGTVVCFSAQADVVAGAVLLPMAVVSLREVRQVRELPFAALPLLFALHQLIEA